MTGLGTRVDHVGIAVQNADETIPVYESLGMKVLLDRTLAVEGVRAVLLGGDSRVELLEAVGEGGALRRFLERKGEGLHHVALQVEDLDRAIEVGAARGLVPTGETRQGIDGRRVVFFHPATAKGTLIELVEGPPP